MWKRARPKPGSLRYPGPMRRPAVPRENSAFQAKDHPTAMPSGASVVVDRRQMDDLLDRIQNGDPRIGWEGDPRFCLAFNRPEQRWELWRREMDEEYRLFARSKPGMSFPVGIVEEIVKHDVRRGYDPKADVDAHNARVDADKAYRRRQAMGPVYEKLFWSLRQDDRTGAGL